MLLGIPTYKERASDLPCRKKVNRATPHPHSARPVSQIQQEAPLNKSENPNETTDGNVRCANRVSPFMYK